MKGKYLSRPQIEQMVDNLLAEHNINSVPVPIEAIARAEGLPIVETEMDADISGALIRSNDLKGIAINAKHAMVRKRFTIGHELAHYLLEHVSKEDHLDYEFTVIRRDGHSSEAEDYQEIIANFFAASVLMPKRFLRADVEKFKNYRGIIKIEDLDIIQLSQKYRVSEAAMRYRLQNLGFISWV